MHFGMGGRRDAKEDGPADCKAGSMSPKFIDVNSKLSLDSPGKPLASPPAANGAGSSFSAQSPPSVKDATVAINADRDST